MTENNVREVRERSLVRCLLADASTGKVLVMLRGGKEWFGHGLWEILQGSRESGETPREAVLRELEEEIGVNCQPLVDSDQLQLLPVSDDHFGIVNRHDIHEDWSNYNYLLLGHDLTQVLGELTMDDSHEEARWVTPSEAHALLGTDDYSAAGRRMLEMVPNLYETFLRAASAMRVFSPEPIGGESEADRRS